MSQKNNLLIHIIALSVLAFVLFAALMGVAALIRWNGYGSLLYGANSVEVTKIALAVVGGIGGVGYLVIKYRERKDEEVTRAGAEFAEAVEKIAHDSVQWKIYGIHALASIADRYGSEWDQKVVEQFCALLRVSSVGKDEIGEGKETALSALQEHVISLLRERLSDSDASGRWSKCHFNFRGAKFVVCPDFGKSFFCERPNFRDCEFSQGVIFRDVTFEKGVELAGIVSGGVCDFTRAVSEGQINLSGCKTNRDLLFESLRLEVDAAAEASSPHDVCQGVLLNGAQIEGSVCFHDARLKGHSTSLLSLEKTEIKGDLCLYEASVEGSYFSTNRRFEGEMIDPIMCSRTFVSVCVDLVGLRYIDGDLNDPQEFVEKNKHAFSGDFPGGANFNLSYDDDMYEHCREDANPCGHYEPAH